MENSRNEVAFKTGVVSALNAKCPFTDPALIRDWEAGRGSMEAVEHRLANPAPLTGAQASRRRR